MEKASTIDPHEAAHFGALAGDWWDPNGSSAMLHKLNPVRLKYIREQIDRHWRTDETGLKPLAGRIAADVGCGAGLLAEPLARLGAAVTGIDAAPENIAAVRACGREGDGDRYRVGGAEALAGRFDGHYLGGSKKSRGRAFLGACGDGGRAGAVLSRPQPDARSKLLCRARGGDGRIQRARTTGISYHARRVEGHGRRRAWWWTQRIGFQLPGFSSRRFLAQYCSGEARLGGGAPPGDKAGAGSHGEAALRSNMPSEGTAPARRGRPGVESPRRSGIGGAAGAGYIRPFRAGEVAVRWVSVAQGRWPSVGASADSVFGETNRRS